MSSVNLCRIVLSSVLVCSRPHGIPMEGGGAHIKVCIIVLRLRTNNMVHVLLRHMKPEKHDGNIIHKHQTYGTV